MKKNAFTPYIYRIFIFANRFLHTEGGWIENATAAKDQRPMLAVCALPIPLLLQKTKATKGRVFKIELSKVSDSALAAEICTGPHNRLLRRQHCSSLCSQSEGHEHVANMTNALGHNFVGFSVLVRHNIRPPHFASKVSYSASPQASAKCPRSDPCTAAPERGAGASLPTLIFLYFEHPTL